MQCQVDEAPVEYASEGGQSREGEGHGRRRQVGQRSPRHGEEEGGEPATGEDTDAEEVTIKDSP